MNTKNTGMLISMARKEKGMTQLELAEILNVSDRTISKWERGAGFPDVSLLTPLADALGLSVVDLLQGSRGHDTAAELSVREALTAACRQMKENARRNRNKILAAAAIFLVAAGAVFGGLYQMGKNRILFPPRIHGEILMEAAADDAFRADAFRAELLVKKANTGVYRHTCRYELDAYGNASVAENFLWQSYIDTVPGDVCKKLKALSEKELLTVRQTETGFLAVFYGSPHDTITIIETDAACNVSYKYELDTADYTTPCEAVFSDGERLCVLSYREMDDRLFITSVDKVNGAEKTVSFCGADLHAAQGDNTAEPYGTDADGAAEPYGAETGGLPIGGFNFNGGNLWAEDDVLYFAETNYSEKRTAVFGACNLTDGKIIKCVVAEDAQVMNVRRDRDRGTVQILINRGRYEPLELYELDAETLRERGKTLLELPHEYLAGKGYQTENYLLFQSDIDGERAAVLFPELMAGGIGSALTDMRSYILLVYDCQSGETACRTRLTMDVNYEIYEIQLPEGF